MEIQHSIINKENNTPSLPPSTSSSPSHEFSFTISFDSTDIKSHQPDLTPADEIFFHGHLLPLQVISPRSSTNSLESFTLPVTELVGDEDKPNNLDSWLCSNGDQTKRHSFNSYEYNTRRENSNEEDELPSKKRVKSKSFSFFGFARRRKEEGCEDRNGKTKRKLKFDVSHFLKKYIRMFSKGRREDIQLRKQPYSFSGKLSSGDGKWSLRGRRREFSAPASIRTSPTNSGILKMTPPSCSSNDSTMEELQAAIQAAIAHCKNSIANATADNLMS